jgi:hypothetical protein
MISDNNNYHYFRNIKGQIEMVILMFKYNNQTFLDLM